jgi:hypothetical protein
MHLLEVEPELWAVAEELPKMADFPPKPAQWYSEISQDAVSHFSPKSGLQSQAMSLNDLEFAYAPVRDQVRDLREYL